MADRLQRTDLESLVAGLRLSEKGQELITDALELAYDIGQGDLEVGAVLILKHRAARENNFERFLAELEPEVGKILSDSYPTDARPQNFSLASVSDAQRKYASSSLTDDEQTLLECALIGDRHAVVDLIAELPDFLRVDEILDHFVGLLRDARTAKRGTAEVGEYRRLLQCILPDRPGGKYPINDRDVKMASLALVAEYHRRGDGAPVDAAREKIARVLNVSDDFVYKRTHPLFKQGRPHST
jgi:hypothetical protein